MGSNPCSCMPLQRGVKILAITDAFIAGISILLVVTFLFLVSSEAKTNPKHEKLYDFLIIALTIALVIQVCMLGLALLLYKGGEKQNPRTLHIWRIITIVLVVLTVISFFSRLGKGEAGSESIWFILWIPFKIYELLVVFAFIQQIKSGEVGNGTVSMPAVAGVPGNTPEQHSTPKPQSV